MEKQKINTKKAIKFLPLAYLGFAIIFGVIAFGVNLIIQVPENDFFNATALTLEAGIGIAITWTVYLYSKRMHEENAEQQKEIKDLIKSVENREKKNKEYLEGQLIRSLAHIRHESKRANEELEHMSSNHISTFEVADMIWNPLKTTSAERLSTLVEASNGLIDASILDKINAIKAEIKIDLVRNIPMAMVQCIGVSNLINNLFSSQLSKVRKKVSEELNAEYEKRKKIWEEKGLSGEATESQRLWTEAELRKFDEKIT